MIKLFTQSEYDDTKPSETLPLQCSICKETFYRKKAFIRDVLNNTTDRTYNFCSVKCNGINKTKSHTITTKCSQCQTPTTLRKSQKSKSGNQFCSSSCAAKYNNAHRKVGIKRSQAELLIEQLIQIDFPNLEIKTNVRDILPSKLEIDILLPSLNIAIELNGPVHYFPIYGESKFRDIQNKDILKQIELQTAGFNLIVIDISKMKHWSKAKNELETYYQNYIKPLLNTTF